MCIGTLTVNIWIHILKITENGVSITEISLENVEFLNKNV